MIRSSKTTLAFSNTSKRVQITSFIDEYRVLVAEFVDILWDMDKVPSLVPASITNTIKTDLSARIIQCAAKQASGVVRGARTKQEKRKYIVTKLTKEGKFKQARKLQALIDKTLVSKPKITKIQPELDSRFVKIDMNNTTSFDGWITISSIGNKRKITLPFKSTTHMNKLMKSGVIKTGVRLSATTLTFMFEIPDVSLKETGGFIGIDVGQTTAISASNGFVSTPNKHNHDLVSINTVMCRKIKGSNAFRRAQQHRTNYIKWSINQLNLDDTKELRVEDLKNIRKGRKTSKKLSHWTYTEIFSKLESHCELRGVRVTKVNPTYTSKRCSCCGWTRSKNRKGKIFKCSACGFTGDSDLNASNNICTLLKPIWYKQRQKFDIRTGFYWRTEGQAPIVPAVQRNECHVC